MTDVPFLVFRKGFTEGTYGSSPDGAKVIGRSRKGEKLNKRNIQHSDGAKYMSYIKVAMLWLEHLMNLFKIFQWSWFCLFSHQKSEISHVAAIIQQDVSPAILSLEFLHRMLFISVLHVWKFCWDSLIIWNFLEFQWLILFLHPSSPPFFIIFQVSREHYQRVKNSMKHNSNSIQPRSLSNVLGDMENLHVQPFEFYEEEERQKLHDHWLVLWSKTFLLVYQCFPHQFIVCVCTGCTWQTEMSLLVLQTGYRDVHRDCKWEDH